jgi:hypothetical protein
VEAKKVVVQYVRSDLKQPYLSRRLDATLRITDLLGLKSSFAQQRFYRQTRFPQTGTDGPCDGAGGAGNRLEW